MVHVSGQHLRGSVPAVAGSRTGYTIEMPLFWLVPVQENTATAGSPVQTPPCCARWLVPVPSPCRDGV